jgi:hypothetical protein
VRQQRPANLAARCIAIRMQNAVSAVRPFACQHQLARMLAGRMAIKVRIPLQQLFHPRGTLFDQHARRDWLRQAVARGERVFQVQLDVLCPADSYRDSTLRILRVRFAKRFLRHHENAARVSQCDGGAKTGNSGADDQEICNGRNATCGVPHEPSVEHYSCRRRELSDLVAFLNR